MVVTHCLAQTILPSLYIRVGGKLPKCSGIHFGNFSPTRIYSNGRLVNQVPINICKDLKLKKKPTTTKMFRFSITDKNFAPTINKRLTSMLDMPSRYLPKPIHTRSSIYLLFTIDLAKSYPGRKKLIDNPEHTVQKPKHDNLPADYNQQRARYYDGVNGFCFSDTLLLSV